MRDLPVYPKTSLSLRVLPWEARRRGNVGNNSHTGQEPLLSFMKMRILVWDILNRAMNCLFRDGTVTETAIEYAYSLNSIPLW